MKKIYLYLFLSFNFLSSFAHEGMWIPLLLEQLNEKDMKNMGMRISADDIYSVNHSSLKDAVVLFGGGCSAAIVSDQGLLLTNHHCGYGSIQRQSSINHDYLTDGFWAQRLEEELPNPGITVTLLIRMEDVTQKVLEGVQPSFTEAKRAEITGKNMDRLEKEAENGTHYKARIKPFYYGNQYLLFITEVFSDIRLVGAPPSNIGKFGGDTDNWMWPRHTGDFSVFRIYAGKDNQPAEYSKENVPYTPKKHMPVSLKGVQEGDFTFVFGYPGSTQEYIPSFGVDMTANVENPPSIMLRRERLNIYETAMNQDKLVRLQYAAKDAGVANYWKKMIGETRGVNRLNAIAKKQQQEKEFITWANSTPELKVKYGKLIPAFEQVYKEITPLNLATDYVIEAGLGVEIIKYAYGFDKLVNLSKNEKTTQETLDKAIENYRNSAEGFFKNYSQDIDKKVFAKLLSMYYSGLDKNLQPSILDEANKKYHGDFNKWAEDVFNKSVFASKDKILVFLKSYKKSRVKKIENDPAFALAKGIYGYYLESLKPKTFGWEGTLDSLQRIYMQGLMEWQPKRLFYPDANSTLRVSYGKVEGYHPQDAVTYNWFSTLDGIMEKENPDIYDYKVEPKLKQLYQSKDFGDYADADGKMHVGFVASNHTTGGNSGSPVLNADGQLIGLNFDRCWEGTMSDLTYDPDQCRNITLDIRYCLFIIDKFAGDKRLIEEMTLVK
ncbi:MAG: S46 family peptidase [Lentimicrobiaceae bacterium]|nr:S46 family peptidase [Lentimicrobiaceae bacterium]